MSKKVRIFSVDADVTAINLELYYAAVEIAATASSVLEVEYEEDRRLHIAAVGGELYVKQDRRLISRLSRRPRIIVRVPDCLVPSVNATGDNLRLSLLDGLFDRFACAAENGKIFVKNAALSEAEIVGGNADCVVDSVTVKGKLLCSVASGGIVLEHCFALYAECRSKRGNLGAVSLNCKDVVFETANGNISVTLDGEKCDTNLNLFAKNGTCNQENRSEHPDAQHNLKAYTGKGNIVVDYLGGESEKQETTDEVGQSDGEAAVTWE